jgi:hypothetical protein
VVKSCTRDRLPTSLHRNRYFHAAMITAQLLLAHAVPPWPETEWSKPLM